jgi:DNA-binding MarR family transcriptional regulator
MAKTQQRIQKPSQDEKIMMALVKAAELFKRKSAAIFKEHGLSFSQYNVLRVLESSDEGQQAINQVGKAMLASAPNLSGIAKRLENGGFITRRGADGDERIKLLTITAKGRRVLGRIAAKQEDNVQLFMSACPPKKKQELFAVFRAMLELE